jgi:acetyltransferase-like isoleucine patch superfamily enzyme
MKDVRFIGKSKLYGKTKIGEGSVVFEECVFGFPEQAVIKELLAKNLEIEDYDFPGTVIGRGAVIRPRCTFYSNVTIGANLRTGHNVLVREKSEIGDSVLLGTNVVLDGASKIGSHVSIQSNVYIPLNTIIEDYVFLGPCCAITNDKYPIRPKEIKLEGAILRKGSSVGSNAVIMPGVEVGVGAIVGGGSVVTKDVPAWKIVAGNPAKIIKDVPKEYQVLNRI